MKKVAFRLSIPLALALVAALGFLAGRRATLAPIKEQLAKNPMNTLSAGSSLADIFPSDEKRLAASACFMDGAQVAPRFAEISWAPPAVPAPFLGFGPRPGRHLNAFITPLLLRAASDPVLPKPPGKTRVLLVGGSVAFGSGAPSQDRTIAGFMEKLLPGVEVFTLAYPWWTSTHERIAIEERAAALEPDLVVVLTGFNDIRAALGKADVRWMRTPVDSFFFERVSDDYKLAGFEPLVDVVPAASAPPSPEEVARRLEANVLQEAQALPGRVRVFLQPSLFATKKPLGAHERSVLGANAPETAAYFERSLAAIRAALGSREDFSDLSSACDDAKDDVFLDTAHVADRGDELIARKIIEKIQRR